MRVNHIAGGRGPQREISVFDAIDKFVNDDFSIFRNLFNDPPRQVRAIQTGGFPPTNISVNDQKQFTIEVALAGVPRDKINIDFQNRTITLTVNMEPQEGQDTDENKKKSETLWIQRGIRKQVVIENQWTIPETFDIEKASAAYNDGLLTITIPLNEKEERLLEKRTIKLLE